ncbi:MAG: 50S ribosomal protein L18 [Nanoarchaeota archaeon]|nr:50S ribosomal protein L18 [Nanoarchaeota archaeon]
MRPEKSRVYTVQYRRKRSSRTDYRRRISLLKSGKDRLVIRRSLKSMVAQIVRYEPQGDKVIVTATTNDLKKYGLKTSGGNVPVAYLVGLLAGKKAIKQGIKFAVADIGLHPSTKGSRVYAVIKGAIDAGLKVPVSEEILPSKEKIEGTLVDSYAKMLEEKKVTGPFSEYQKNSIKPGEIKKYFESIKNKITGGS